MILDCRTTAASRSGEGCQSWPKRSQVSSEGAADPALLVPLAAQITEPDRAVLRHERSPALAGWCG